MILTVRAVTAGVVGDIRQRGERVGEEKLVYGGHDIVVGIDKEEVVSFLSVNEDSCLAGSAEVSRSVVFTAHARGEDGVHEHVRQGIRLSRYPVAEAAVYRPHMDTLRYLLVRS